MKPNASGDVLKAYNRKVSLLDQLRTHRESGLSDTMLAGSYRNDSAHFTANFRQSMSGNDLAIAGRSSEKMLERFGTLVGTNLDTKDLG